MAQKEQKEIDVIQAFMPPQMTSEETEAALKEVIALCGATSIKDMGKVMATLKETYSGKNGFFFGGWAFEETSWETFLEPFATAARL